ncbi:MAG: thermonuclease family protein [Kiloniellales bacterium]
MAAVWLLAITGHPALAEVAGMPKIIDGDTIEVQGQAIRLYGIDAPELGQACTIEERTYDCGMVARTALLDLTAGVAVTCKVVSAKVVSAEPGRTAEDGRPGRCFAQGYDLSEGMAYTGWALTQREVSERYLVFEERAQAAGRGLWKGRFVTPWDWRGGARLTAQGAAE